MKWIHQCDLNWMKARQKCLTATDVKDLLPVTKTGRKRTIDDESYIKVMARKLVNLTEESCISVGVAARGHILEPYAIELFNESFDFVQLNHWDDLMVTKLEHEPFGLSFSPDAMDTEMRDDANPKVIGEVKSYSAEKHMACGYTNKMDLEERWQLATAMAVRDSIEEAYLLFFNPSMRNQLYVFDYDRTDLADEIEVVKKVEEDWLAWVASLGKIDHGLLVSGDQNQEQVIIEQIIKAEELNPDNKKSIIL